MDGLVQIQVVVQGNVAVGLMGLDTQGSLVRRTLGSKVTCALLRQMDEH